MVSPAGPEPITAMRPRVLAAGLAYQAHAAVEVGYESFQLANMYRLSFLAQYAMSLALLLVRAYASAYSRQVTLVVDYLHGVTEITFRKLVNPVGNVVAYGASFLALRNFAVKTALGLVYGFEHGIALVYLVK